MKKFALFLLKHNIYIMTIIFVGWAIWSIINWDHLLLIQKFVLGLYGLLIVHEYEEGYKDRFVQLMAGRLLQIDYKNLTPGVTHIAQAVYITVLFSLALIFPTNIWLIFGILILGIFEGFVHNMGIFMFQLKGTSPGWYTAVAMAAYSIWAIIRINQTTDYDGIMWFWGFLWFYGTFLCLQISVQFLFGTTPKNTILKAKSFLKHRFRKEN